MGDFNTCAVRCTINFNNNGLLTTDKIGDVGADIILADKFHSVEPATAQHRPRSSAEVAGERRTQARSVRHG
jgi:hypothetical protein